MVKRHVRWAGSMSKQCPWAQAAPSVGPGFVSTALRPDAFQAESNLLRANFEEVLNNVEEEGSEDLDCSDLCLPTLKEEVDSIVAQKLEAEKELSTDKGSGVLRHHDTEPGSQAKDLDAEGERSGEKLKEDTEGRDNDASEKEAIAENQQPQSSEQRETASKKDKLEKEAIAETEQPKSSQERETANKKDEYEDRQGVAPGEQAKADEVQSRLLQENEAAGQEEETEIRRDETSVKKSRVDEQQPAAYKEKASQEEVIVVRGNEASDKGVNGSERQPMAFQEQEAGGTGQASLTQQTDQPPIVLFNERSDQAQGGSSSGSKAKKGNLQLDSAVRSSSRARKKPNYFAPTPFAPAKGNASGPGAASLDGKQARDGQKVEAELEEDNKLLKPKRKSVKPFQRKAGDGMEGQEAKNGHQLEMELQEKSPQKKPKRAKPSQKELENGGEHEKAKAEDVGKGEQKVKAGKGTKHWRPSGEAHPPIPQAENLVSNMKQAGRDKQEGGNKNIKRPALPQIGGEGKNIEEKRLEAFKQSAHVLRSVDEALKVPALYCTAFQVRPDFPCDDLLDAKPASLSGQALDKNETILRIEIREFDVFHSTQQEFLVPGSQKVHLLRDRLHCPADDNLQSLSMAVQGAFFYIEGVFYVDTRQSAQDYVSHILDFCEAHDIQPPPEVGNEAEAFPDEKRHFSEIGHEEDSRYRQMDMARVCWNEIGLRIGPAAKNVFCHQGCCEHLLVVKDVRSRHPDDPSHLNSYPYLIQEDAPTKRLCNICSELVAQKVTYDDKNAPQEPAFWCGQCYDFMHYDGNNTLLYDHRVFQYHGG